MYQQFLDLSIQMTLPGKNLLILSNSWHSSVKILLSTVSLLNRYICRILTSINIMLLVDKSKILLNVGFYSCLKWNLGLMKNSETLDETAVDNTSTYHLEETIRLGWWRSWTTKLSKVLDLSIIKQIYRSSLEVFPSINHGHVRGEQDQ